MPPVTYPVTWRGVVGGSGWGQQGLQVPVLLRVLSAACYLLRVLLIREM